MNTDKLNIRNNEYKNENEVYQIEKKRSRDEVELVLQRYKNYDKFHYGTYIEMCKNYKINPDHLNSVYITRLVLLEEEMDIPILNTYIENNIISEKKKAEVIAKYPWVLFGNDDVPLPTDTINFEKYIRECLNTLTDDELKMLVPNEVY
jgi:plasmid replication initiation protein